MKVCLIFDILLHFKQQRQECYQNSKEDLP